MVKRERMEEILQENIDWQRNSGYPGTEVLEEYQRNYRERADKEEREQQQRGK